MLVIKDWDKTFENANSRKRVRLGWLYCPASLDSAGYIELMSHGAEGIMAFGVFLAICQLSATRRPEHRGKVARSGGEPMDERQIATHLRMDVCHVSASLELLKSPGIQWILEVDDGSDNLVCHSSATNLPPVSHIFKKEKEKEKEKVSPPPSPPGIRWADDLPIPISLDAPEFRGVWKRYLGWWMVSGKRLDAFKGKAQLEMLARSGLEKAVADLRLTMEQSERPGRIWDSSRGVAAKPSGQPTTFAEAKRQRTAEATARAIEQHRKGGNDNGFRKRISS